MLYDPKETNLAKIVTSIQRNLKKTQCEYKDPSSFSRGVMCAGGIIYDNIYNKFLVVKGKEKWSFPKGHKDIGEEPHETAMREIYEETSLKVNLNSTSESRKILKTIYYFMIIENGSKNALIPIDLGEITEIKWCTKQQLISLNGNKQIRYFLKNWDLMIQVINKHTVHLNGAITKVDINVSKTNAIKAC
jgi:8-oxo-dGTP pyrophosphatase MutT (NUDIX family)